MSLEQILKEIKEVKPFAEGDAEDGPIETLAGRRGRKVQATERLKQLKRQYIRDLFDVLGRYLEDKANELDISEYPQLIFKDRYTSEIPKYVDEAAKRYFGEFCGKLNFG